MYYEPRGIVRIGSDTNYIEFLQQHEIEIEESVKSLGDKATITLPKNYRKLDGKSILEVLSIGDPVKIYLGYNGNMKLEFSGFLDEIEANAPLVLHVDDCFYPLKRNSNIKAFKQVSLRQLLTYVAPTYTIECPDVNLGAFSISNQSSFRVLQRLQEEYGFSTYIRGTVLKCQFAYDVRGTGDIHTYTFYTKDVKKNDLKYSRKIDKHIKVRVISNLKNGKKIKYETGTLKGNAQLYETSLPPMTLAELKVYAEKWLNTLSYDGYKGSITGFGTPATQAGDVLKIIDPIEKDREGNYLIEKVKKRYSLKYGFERVNHLSYRV